jgi:hypothetical protein
MTEAEYWANEITDAQLDVQADAGLYHLNEDGFFEQPTDAEIDRVAYRGERHLHDSSIISMLNEWNDCDSEL